MALNIVTTSDGAEQLLADALPGTPDLTIRLFSNSIPFFARVVTRTDLTECTFDGYAPVDPGWSPVELVAGVATTTAGTANFVYSGTSTTVIYGFFITDEADDKFYGGNLFPSPITLDELTTTLSLGLIYQGDSKFG